MRFNSDLADIVNVNRANVVESIVVSGETPMPVTGEIALLVAVFIDGIDTWRKWHPSRNGGQRTHWFEEADVWLQSADRHGLYSFVGICERFGLSPQYVRQQLYRWAIAMSILDGHRKHVRTGVRQALQIKLCRRARA